MVMWTVLEWLMSPVLTLFFNIYGVAIAQSVIAFTSIIPIIIVSRMVKINILEQAWRPLFAAIVMAAITYDISMYVVTNFITLLIVVGIGGALYSLFVFFLAKKQVLFSIRTLKQS